MSRLRACDPSAIDNLIDVIDEMHPARTIDTQKLATETGRIELAKHAAIRELIDRLKQASKAIKEQ